ncbi:amidohydrolase family protein [Haliscomenobacter hydrossis]|uniref:Amidohydrolase n=1 Tax=Haliscomenobacter hydrossis (strain ATCC 27775 / DSM 1100 / LMG 10767 / O) TaxID=760192 RepID=F4L095_HALH1|nr:amidohydrolase family protein [Haliscomenobacter hydrossis]AEE53768.1 amidohydrolase [Haliscomenobacter hydrossis DSM 1100]
MRTLFTTLLIIAGFSTGNTQSKVTAFTHANVIPMTGETVLKDYTVLIKDGKVFKMAPSSKLKVKKKAKAIDATGKYLIPGLAEMHAHIPTPVSGDDSEVRNVLFLYVANGVTTIRGMLGDPYHLGLRKEVMDEKIIGPRIFTSSPSMNGNSIKTPEEARQKVTQFKKDGYDFLKIHPGVKREVFDTLAKTAQALNLPFSGHVPVEVGIRHALASRYASVDHIDGYLEGLVSADYLHQNPNGGFFGYNYVPQADEKLLAALAAETKKQGVWIVPTQSLFTRWFSPTDAVALANEPEMQYMPSKTLYQWRQNKQNLTANGYSEVLWQRFILVRQKTLLALHGAGVDLLLGSDAPQVFNVPGFSLRHEMKSLVEAGLSPQVILQSGTANPARFFGLSGQFGTIQPGASADLILLEDNPLDNIDNTWKQLGVMLRGNWLSKAFIEAELRKIAEENKS